jgi:hypothetical protein
MAKRLVAQPCFAFKAGTLIEAERDHTLNVLNEVGGIIGEPFGAASRIGIPRTSLIYKMRKLGIKQEKTKPQVRSVSNRQSDRHEMPVAGLNRQGHHRMQWT